MGRVKDIDRGWHKIIQEVQAMTAKEVAVGIQKDAGKEENGKDLAIIAAYNEFGTENIPARPFMRRSFDLSQSRMIALVQSEAKKMLEGKQGHESVLKKAGLFMEGQAKKYIASPVWTPNSPATIARKGSSQPLVDTGTMRQSVRYAIRRRTNDE